jgi:hypothetical protein
MAINREKAIADLAQIKVKGNQEGMIPAFGVLVQFLPANFWNTFTEKMLSVAGDRYLDDVEAGLEQAAAECGYHTGWGIINSDEFKSIVGPMIENVPEDVLHGAYAVFSAWGWAKCEIVELVPGQKKVIRAYEYYEAKIKETLKLKKHCAYMIKGVTRAFMDIAYGGEYPDGFGHFKCRQTKGIEFGDSYGEFVITTK